MFYLDHSNITVNDSEFYANQACNLGGVARISSKSFAYIDNSSFTANHADFETSRGGVMYYADKSNIIMSKFKQFFQQQSIFWRNSKY